MNLQNRESIGQLISVLHRRHSEIVRAISVYDSHNRCLSPPITSSIPANCRSRKARHFPVISASSATAT
jgi:two-component system sensor histidine kinase BarA